MLDLCIYFTLDLLNSLELQINIFIKFEKFLPTFFLKYFWLKTRHFNY